MQAIRAASAVINPPALPSRIFRLTTVTHLTGLSRATIYRRMADGSFPRQVSLGGPTGRAVGWRESDIAAFIDGLQTGGAQ